MAGQQQGQTAREPFDGITDAFEPLLTSCVCADSIGSLPRMGQRGDPSAHRVIACGARTIASASSRYAARSDAETDSTGTPCMPAYLDSLRVIRDVDYSIDSLRDRGHVASCQRMLTIASCARNKGRNDRRGQIGNVEVVENAVEVLLRGGAREDEHVGMLQPVRRCRGFRARCWVGKSVAQVHDDQRISRAKMADEEPDFGSRVLG